jgi:hypothetical protein
MVGYHHKNSLVVTFIMMDARMANWAALYVIEHGGFVQEECFKYQAKVTACPTKCENDKEWKSAHICNCHELKQCLGVKSIKKCLKTGPATVTFEVARDFYSI